MNRIYQLITAYLQHIGRFRFGFQYHSCTWQWACKSESSSMQCEKFCSQNRNPHHGAFTLTVTDAETDTRPIQWCRTQWDLCWSRSLGSMNTSTQCFTSQFLSVSVSVLVSGSVNTHKTMQISHYEYLTFTHSHRDDLVALMDNVENNLDIGLKG